MSRAICARLDEHRLHFQHGPIDLVLEAWGGPAEVERAYARAWTRFGGLLDELVGELMQLRAPVQLARVSGAVAVRMVRACLPYQAEFITPMAAVAGAVADEVMAALTAEGGVARAYINNGGDIALHLAEGERFRVGLAVDPVISAPLDGRFEILSTYPVRGIATSGWRGRSWSLGIADSVSVLARDAASADAAATMIANAVNVDHPSIVRKPATEVDDNTDLGKLLVTCGVGALPRDAVDEALAHGVARAQGIVKESLAWGVALMLQGQSRVVGADGFCV